MNTSKTHLLDRWTSGLLVAFAVFFVGCGASIEGTPPPDSDTAADVASSTDLASGVCMRTAECRENEWCSGEGCGTAGRCIPRPTHCTTEFSPVCGCDRGTYANLCAASVAGVRQAARGPCEALPDGGAPDGSTVDTGSVDTGSVDTGSVDTGSVDTGSVDTGSVDTGSIDIGGPELGGPDLGRPDLTPLDLGIPGVDAGLDGGLSACSTSVGCAPSSECVYPEAMCARSGVCTPRLACLVAESFCACTGETYAACRPDRSTQSRGACPTPVDAGTDTGTSFCALVRCTADTFCCEAARACIPRGSVCGAPTDAGADVSPTECRDDRGCPSGQACCAATGLCYPAACLGCCMPRFDAGTDAEPRGCTSARECGLEGECVFPESLCSLTGVCMVRSLCIRPETFCACTGETYLSCRPDRPTQSRSACPTRVDSGLDASPTACRDDRGCPTGQACCTGTRLCYPAACLGCCRPTVDAGPSGCATSIECGLRGECVYPDTGCASRGTCMTRIACFVAQPFCACTGETYLSCNPDRPTRASGRCEPDPTFCATARCVVGTRCCEATRSCLPTGVVCPSESRDAGPALCRSESDCSDGQLCCTGSGRCYDPRCLSCCMFF